MKSFFSLSRKRQIALVVFLVHFTAVFALLGHHLWTRKPRVTRSIAVKTIDPIYPSSSEIKIQNTASISKKISKSPDAIGQVKAKPSPKRPALILPRKIQPKAQVTSQDTTDPTYAEILIALLQHELDLPEYGEVRTKIEIDRFGKLLDCEILEAKSEKNAAFLKNQLPELAFPCLNGGASQTFTIIFRNAETHVETH